MSPRTVIGYAVAPVPQLLLVLLAALISPRLLRLLSWRDLLWDAVFWSYVTVAILGLAIRFMLRPKKWLAGWHLALAGGLIYGLIGVGDLLIHPSFLPAGLLKIPFRFVFGLLIGLVLWFIAIRAHPQNPAA
jgi:hypothetical protein